ncbi:MAG TPA: mandelate racemase/muconate lactonizing enzyme family protein [Acidobacteriaceae bacterium]|nr:mandelate racemase/muconate lactonizing enzyme family protein [Acidobacteriaceae bacterium]
MAPALALADDMKKQIKITGIETDVLRFPPGKIYYDAIHEFGAAGGAVVLRVQTNAGITGWADCSFGTMEGAPKVLQSILEDEIKQVLVGQDPSYPKRLRSDMWKALEYSGVQGVAQFAISAAEVAIWDILGKAAGLPVYKMLGAYADRVPVYSMCGWYYPDDNDLSQFKKVVEAAFDEGFSAAKIKVGRFSLDDDVRRIRAAMEIAGKNRRIMVDANQKFDVDEAILRGKVYQEMGCYWLEEPIVPYDHAGYAQVAEALDMRVAGGENEYTKYAFADLISRHSVDVVQPDGRRAGGVSEWMEIGAIADAAKLPVASHGGGPADLQMLLAMPNAIYMESGSFKGQSSTIETLHMVESAVLAPERPGMGSELRPDYIQKHRA